MIGDSVGTTAQTATYGGGAAAMFFGLTANETAAIVGAIVAVIGLGVQVWYTLDKRKRGIELHRLEVERLKYANAPIERHRSEDDT